MAIYTSEPYQLRITTLHPKSGQDVCKTMAIGPDGSISKLQDYPKITLWFLKTWDIAPGVEGLHQFIDDISKDRQAVLVSGAQAGGLPVYTAVRRLKYPRDGDEATLAEVSAPWLAIDVDKFPLKDRFDASDSLKAIDEVLEKLGSPFNKTSFIWLLTASASPGSAFISVRLFFLTDKPINNDERLTWSKGLNQFLGQKLVDPMLYSAAQLIYTASPKFQNADHDPIPQRNGLVWEEKEHLIWNEVPIHTQKVAVGAYSGSEWAGKTHRSIEQHLAAIGDHEGGEGFHTPMRDAIFQMVIHKWSEQRIIDVIRDTVTNADQSAHHLQQLKGYLTDRELKRNIKGASQRIKISQHTPRVMQTRGVIDALPLAEAEKKVAEAIQEWFEEPSDAVWVIKSTVGVGKTHAAVSTARQKLSGNLKTLLWAAPNHHQGEEVLQAFNAPWPEEETAEDDELGDIGVILSKPKAIKIEGRISPESRPGEDLCRRPQLINQIKKAGRASQTNRIACEREGARCPYFSSCGYMEQFYGPERVRIFPHSYLTLPKSRVMDKQFVQRSWGLIIDESPVQTLIDKLRFYDLDDVLVKGGVLADALTQLKAGEPLEDAWIKRLEKEQEERYPFTDMIFSPLENDESLLMAELKDLEGKDGGLYVLYSQVIRVAKGDKKLVWFGKNALGKDRVLCARRFDIPEMKTLILDATADEETYQSLFGERLRFIEVHAEQNLELIQVSDSPVGKAKLLGTHDANGKLIPGTDDLLARVCALARMEDAVFVSNLEAVNQAKERGYLEQDHQTAHFNALRGLNKFETAQSLVIAGRPEPDALTLEAMGRALYPTADLDLTGTLEWRQDGVSSVASHADPRIDAILRGIRESEIIQAIGRLRAVRSKTLKKVFLITHTPTGLPAHQMRLDDLLPSAALARVFLKFDGIVPLAPRVLSEEMPEIWGSEKEAEDWIRRNLKPAIPLYISIYKQNAGFKSEVPHEPLLHQKRTCARAPLVFLYRVKGQKRHSRVLVWRYEFEAQITLEKFLGQEIVEFRPEQVSEDHNATPALAPIEEQTPVGLEDLASKGLSKTASAPIPRWEKPFYRFLEIDPTSAFKARVAALGQTWGTPLPEAELRQIHGWL